MLRVATLVLGATLASTGLGAPATSGDRPGLESHESLEVMAALAPTEAAELARRVLYGDSRDSSLLWRARRILARTGDIDLLRVALSSYFDDPWNWGRVLAEAESTAKDVRLRDFRGRNRRWSSREADRLRTRLWWNLERRAPEDVARDPEPPIRERSEFLELPNPAVAHEPFLDALLATSVDGGIDPHLVARLASSPDAAPGAFAALYRFHLQSGDSFLALLSDRRSALAARARFVMSLSGDTRRLPLLVDLAVREGSRPTREAALNGLAEAELTHFAPRLHRLAGDPERWVRFRAATALLPSGEPWAMRLLVSTIDSASGAEVHWANRAIERLGRDRARSLLEDIVADGTATPFAVERLLELSPEAGRSRSSELWKLLVEAVAKKDPVALLAASRLSDPAARMAVSAYLAAR